MTTWGPPATVNVWMRSANSASQFRNVNTNGNANNNNASNGNNWLRPALTETSGSPSKEAAP